MKISRKLERKLKRLKFVSKLDKNLCQLKQFNYNAFVFYSIFCEAKNDS